MRRRLAVCALSLVCLALAFAHSALFSTRAEAVGNFISVPGRIDSVYDLKRDTIYITQRREVWDSTLQKWVLDSGVVRYHVGSGTYLPRIPITGWLLGLDISPDCSTLLVCDDAHTENQVWIHNVNLEPLEVTKVTFPRAFYEDGTFAVAFGQDGTAFFTTGFEGSGWTPMRRYNPVTGAWSVAIESVRQHTMVSASADGTTIAFVESNSSAGPVGKIDVATGAVIYVQGTGWFNFEVGINRSGSQMVVPTYNGTYVYDGSVQRQTRVGVYADEQPIGQAYHPFEDIVYFAWADWNNTNSRYVKAHRTSDFSELGQWDFESVFNHTGNGAYTEGRLRIARDASYLFSTVDNGVRFASLGSHRPVANGAIVRTREDTPVDVTLTGVAVTGISGVEIVSTPANGSLSGAGPTFTYTPNANFNGQDTFTFRVTDGVSYSPEATVRISVTAVNDPPSFVKGANQSVLQDSGAKSVSNWATSISPGPADEAGQTVTFAVTNDNTALFSSQPAVAAAGTLTFTPAAGKTGTATVTVTAADNGGTANGGQNASSPQTFTITVRPPNRPPVAVDDAVALDEDASLDINVKANDSDPDGDPMAIVSFTQPSHGRTLRSNIGILYIPDANYHGPDSFTYQISDRTVTGNTATVSITVKPVNDAPTADAQSVTTDEDAAVAVVLSGGDIDGDAVTFTVVNGPAHGSLTGSAPNLTYTPAANYSGEDSLTFRTSDGQANSGTATVSITVRPINDPPQVGDQTASTREDVQLKLDLSAFDPDGDPLTWEIVTEPSHGLLSGTPPSVTYTPAANYHGADSLQYRVSDGMAQSPVATVSITVSSENDVPFAHSQNVRTPEDTSLPIELTGADVEGDPLSFELVTPPAHGELLGSPPNMLYVPASDYSGPDFFSFRVHDGTDYSPPGAININATQVNDGPRANAQSVTTAEDTAKAITLTGSDPDGDALTYEVTESPTHGVLSGSAPSLTYTPNANFHGTDALLFRVNDGTSNSGAVAVGITVTPVNDAPSAFAQTVFTTEDTAQAFTLTGFDVEGDPLTFQIAGAPAHGSLSGTAPDLTYTPSANYSGEDSFTFRVSDGSAESAPATVTINISAMNDAPSAKSQSVATPEDTLKSITLIAVDPEGAPLTYEIVSPPAHGNLSDAASIVRYVPFANYHGPDSFTFRVNDGTFWSNVATVDITVTPVNDAPVANAHSVTTAEDTARSITLTGSDPEGQALTYQIEAAPTRGTLTGTAPNLTYTPNPNTNGSDSFTFRVSDGTAQSPPATVSINVTPVNDPPVAVNDTASTPKNTAVEINVRANDSDPEAGGLTVSAVTTSTGGTTAILANGNVRFTPKKNLTGTFSFNYTIRDSGGLTATAQVTVTITGGKPPR